VCQGHTIIVSEVYNNQITQEGSDYEYSIILANSMMDKLGQKEMYSGRRIYYTTIKYYDIV
jgi:hypothetical protein